MVRPTTAQLTVPLSRAKDVTALASVLHVLGTWARLETLQRLMDSPRRSNELPARLDELQMLEGVGLISASFIERQKWWRWCRERSTASPIA